MSSDADTKTHTECGVLSENANILKINVLMSHICKLHMQYLIQPMTRSNDTWTMTKNMEQKLKAAQCYTQRSLQGITRVVWKANKWIRDCSEITDIRKIVKERKWMWAGNIFRVKDKG